MKNIFNLKKLTILIAIVFLGVPCANVSAQNPIKLPISQEQLDSLVHFLDSAFRANAPASETFSRKGTQQTYYLDYDGSTLQARWEIVGKDTCGIIKHLTEGGHIFADFSDKLIHNKRSESIYNCNGNKRIEKNGSIIKYIIPCCNIPVTINGYDSLVFQLDAVRVDSIVFTYTGNDELEYPYPRPYQYHKGKIIWRKKDFTTTENYIQFKIYFRGPYKSFLNFSRADISRYNENVDFLNLALDLMLTLPFWILWILCFKYQNIFKKNDNQLATVLLRWLPILSGFYLLFAILNIYEKIDIYNHLGEFTTPEIERNYRIKSRLIGVIIALALMFLCKYSFRNSTKLWAVFAKRFSATIFWSLIAFILLGLINYVNELFIPDTYSSFSHAVDLSIYNKYPYGLLISGYVFLLICCFQVFKFNLPAQLISLFFLTGLLFLAINDAIQWPVDRKSGTNMEGLFFLERILIVFIPLILACFLWSKITKLRSEKILAILGGFYTLFFCFYSVYPGALFYIPITFLMALLISRWLFCNYKERLVLIRLNYKVEDIEKENISLFKRFFDIKQNEKLKTTYHKRFIAGEMTLSEKEKAIEEIKVQLPTTDESSLQAIIKRLQFGPNANYLENALIGMSIAFVLALIIFSIYFKAYLSFVNGLDDDFMDVYWPSLKYIFAGSCFGLLFPFISGDLGWKKGLYFGLAIAAAELPYEYITTTDSVFVILISHLMKGILIFTLTGFFGFDLVTIIKIYGRDFRIKHITQIEGWKNIIAFGSVILAAIAAGFTAWISGNVSSFLSGIIK